MANDLSTQGQLLRPGVQRLKKRSREGGSGSGRRQSDHPVYKPSEKAEILSGPQKDLGPEFNSGEVAHEMERHKAILRNPKATPEEKKIAQQRIEQGFKTKEARRKVKEGGPGSGRHEIMAAKHDQLKNRHRDKANSYPQGGRNDERDLHSEAADYHSQAATAHRNEEPDAEDMTQQANDASIAANTHERDNYLKRGNPPEEKYIPGGRLHKKKESRHRESVIHIRRLNESFRKNFLEAGEEESQKKGKGRVYDVTIIEEGLGNSKDKNYYSAEALRSGVKVFEGSKCYADHPTALDEKIIPERHMHDLVGWYSDCFTDQNPDSGKTRLRAKLHFFPAAKWLTDMIDVILTEPSAKGLFGISINAVGKTRPAEKDGEEVNYVEEFQRVDSADVVTEPAARGKFNKMLESRRSVAGGHSQKVSKIVSNRRAREAAILSPETTKAIADSLVTAYNSDSPDEAKQIVFEAAKALGGSLGATVGKDDSKNQDEQQNSGGSDEMPKQAAKKLKTSVGKRTIRKGKTLRAAHSQESDVEEAEEDDDQNVSESDESEIEEADADEGGEDDLGDLDDIGGDLVTRQKEARNSRGNKLARAQRESEESDDLDEAEERGDVRVSGVEGGLPGADMAAPVGGGGPGSSTRIANEADESEEAEEDFSDDQTDDFGDDDEDDSMDEAEETVGRQRPSVAAEAGKRGRVKARGREAGGYGTSGKAALPDDTFDQGDNVDSFSGEKNGGAGLSYKMKTSRFSKNKVAKQIAAPIVREANRRIGLLEDKLMRLRESRKAISRKADRLSGIIRFKESKTRAFTLLREAVDNEILPDAVAASMSERLFGLNEVQQRKEITHTARLLESTTEGAVSRMTESVEGNGARGGVAFHYGGTTGVDSELEDGLAEAGIPMKSGD